LSRWICWLGGDPIDQVFKVNKFNEIFKRKYDYKIALYTGYLFESLSDYNVLKYLDLVKDGPYIEERGPLGSKNCNQRVFIKLNDAWEQIDYCNLKPTLKEL
jgi:hypothetical protein